MKKKIGIVGLGLIGGSLAKAVKKYTENTVIGYDKSETVLDAATAEKSIDFAGDLLSLSEPDILIIALYPGQTIGFMKENAPRLKKGCLVIDTCGVKSCVCLALGPLCRENGLIFIGGHPMAGREFSGYSYSTPELFQGANMILTPEGAGEGAVSEASAFFYRLGFGKVVMTTPENHDRMIAFTSQLAHVVSNAYIKSPEALLHHGYSANSYRDLTRVARLNEEMWTELFLFNRDALTAEIDTVIKHLGEYRDAIAQNDETRLKALLKEGSDLKKQIDDYGGQQ
ncbi:MAG: prephenate dehydrogenase/arogenate dehydrogenase family protein [Bacillota bacterium]|nr:prephenate dehydrogenase/arogenate dehydrogenase family protein [Bacillota bacterium]